MGRCTSRSPDFLAHVLSPSAPHKDLESSVQCSNVGLCLYLHPSPDECSMVICKIFISVAKGKGQFRCPLLSCSRNKLGTSPWTPGNPSRVQSLANPKIVPLIKIYTSLLPYPLFLHPNHPIPPSYPHSPLLFSLSPYPHPTLTPKLSIFAWQSCLIPISRRITI